jgi:hypothetical protein
MSGHRILIAGLILIAAVLSACEPLERRGSGSDRVTQEPTDPQGCTLTQGYWKNHEEAWPVDSLTIGGVTYTKEELLTLLRTPTRGDASLILGHQLIAARLNGEQGASSADVAGALAEADAWMTANKDSDGRLPYDARGSVAAEEATTLSGTLALFNEGGTGPGHCDDGASSSSASSSSSVSSSSSGGGECALTCGPGSVVACPPDFDCVNGCCIPIVY